VGHEKEGGKPGKSASKLARTKSTTPIETTDKIALTGSTRLESARQRSGLGRRPPGRLVFPTSPVERP
jgi:hypothetical protein